MAELPAGSFVYNSSTSSPAYARHLILDMPGEIRESPPFAPGYVLGITNDHKRVVCLDADWKVRVWNLDDDTIEAPNDTADASLGGGWYGGGVMTPSGQVIVTGGLLDVSSGAITASPLGSVYIDDAQFSADGSRLYVVNYTAPYLHIFDTATGDAIAHPVVLPARPRSVRVSPDGKLVAVGMPALYAARVYSLATGVQVQSISPGYGDYYNAFFSADGAHMLWSLQSNSQSLRLFDVPAEGGYGAAVNTFGAQYQPFAALVGDGRVLIPNDYYSQHGAYNHGRLLDISDGTLVRMLLGTVQSVAVPPPYVGPPPAVPPFWSNFRRAVELP